MRSKHLFHRLVAAGLLASTATAWAQVPSAAGAPVSSLLDQTPAAPVIRYSGGMLTIEATNSSLRAILDSLGKQIGTAVQGLNRDERVFGIYGPGKPQDVLASLLDDSGYNVLISGQGTDGAPREIVLTAQTSGGGASGIQGGHTQAADENDEDAVDSGQIPPPQPALFAPLPQSAQPQPGTSPSQQQVKTPQQLLEELQRMRQGPAASGSPQP